MSLEKNVLYVLSDNHINRNKFESEKGKFTRKNLEEAFEKIKNNLDKNKNNYLIFGGDTFDKFESTSDFKKWEFWFVDSLKKFFEKEEIKIFIITGNHDCNNISEFTSISGFNKYGTNFKKDLICVENQEKIIEEEDINFFLFPFPFLHKNRKSGFYLKKIKSILNERLNDGKYNILISHFIIDGIKSSKHGGLSHRNVHSNENEIQNLGFNLVLLGDNHVHYDHNGIISIGSSEQVSFSEEGDEKNILKFTFKEDKYEIEKILLEESSNKKMTIEINTTEFNEENFDYSVKKLVEEYEKRINDEKIKKDIRVNIVVKYDQQDKIHLIRDFLSRIKENSICYVENFVIGQQKNENNIDEIDIKDLTNENSLIKEYSEKLHYIDDEKFHNELLDRKDFIAGNKKDIIVENIFSKMNKL